MKKIHNTGGKYSGKNSIVECNESRSNLFNMKQSSDIYLFLQDKIKRMELQDLDLWALLNRFNQNIQDYNFLQTELQLKVSEISDLQLSVSDSQVFLIREREENLRLAAENDMLRIRDLENNRSIHVLLQLCGISREQFNDILSSEPRKDGDSKKKTSSAAIGENCEEDMSREALMLQVKSLKTQLENLKTLFRREVDVLLKDREVLAEERIVVTKKLKQEVAKLSKQLSLSQMELAETAEMLLREHKERKMEIAVFMEDRLSSENKLDAVNRLLCGDATNNSALTISGGGKSMPRSNSRRLQEKVSERDDMITLYQQQAKRFEVEAKIWKEKAEATDKYLKERIQKLSSELTHARNRYEDLDRRRLLEGEGFRSDIKLLRDKLKDLEKKLNKVRFENAMTSPSLQEEDNRISTRNIFNKAKQLEKELAALKLKVAALTNPFS